MKNPDLSKTKAAGIVSANHKGGLLGRIVQREGVLIGQTVMVAGGCRCVVVAGDRVTAVLDEGPHTLDLVQFNRQPSAFLYTVPTAVESVSWFPAEAGVRRTAALRVDQPESFVAELVIAQGLEESGEVVAYLSQRVDTWILPGELERASEAAQSNVTAFFLQHGLTVVSLEELEAQTPPPVPVH